MSVLGGDLEMVCAYVSGEHELILLVLRCLDLDAGPHDDLSYELLADEVPDLDLPLVGLLVLLEVDVDGEMGVDVAHLVLVALGDTDDQVVLLPLARVRFCAYIPARPRVVTYDESSDSAEGGDALAGAVVELNLDEVLLGLSLS
jgi:hypothetical protein